MDEWFRIHYDNRYTLVTIDDIITIFEEATDFDSQLKKKAYLIYL